MQSKDSKNILILSYGPVPTPKYQKIEGGGMRCWGIATGLKKNGHKVTVGINEGFPQKITKHAGINLCNWSLNDSFGAYINSFDAIVVSYCMGDLSVFVADNISDHVCLILDCYVPIYIEISARNSDNKAEELRSYMESIKLFNHVLQRGDYFLCANEPQKHMYAGILGSLGIINPYNYHRNRLLVVPFGIDEVPLQKTNPLSNPYSKLGITNNDFVLLWFGGLYPWFDFKPLIASVNELSKNKKVKFVLVGGKNPFNNHPDFVKQYDFVLEEFDRLGLIGKSVHVIDWVDFDERINWYGNASAVISINQDGDENNYSWRTRVMDYVWGCVPMLTNGGDPLSDYLVNQRAAIKIDKTSSNITATIKSLLSEPAKIRAIKSTLIKVRKSYYWSVVTKIISDELLARKSLPYVETVKFAEQNHITIDSPSTSMRRILSQGSKISKLKSYVRKAKAKGVWRSIKFMLDIIKTQVRSKASVLKKPCKKAFFLSHPIDNTGAPLVLIEIANDFAEKFGNKNIHIVAPGIKKHLFNQLASKNYKIHKMAMGIGGRIIQSNLDIRPDDFVLMNTVAVYPNYKNYLFWMLESHRLKEATWFIHEDKPKIRFTDKNELLRVKELIRQNKLHIVVPSVQTAEEYNAFFKTNKIKSALLKVDVPAKYKIKRNIKDFDTIRFFVSGTPSDGRKGQLLLLAALQYFESNYKNKSPNQFRPYTLDLVAIEDDYISEQIKAIGAAILGDRLHTYPKVTLERSLEITSKCNITICPSLNETFALFVAEGMQMGHVILRNHSSGWQEQMCNGKNGFLFDDLNIKDLAKKISLVLDRKTSSDTLLKMGLESQRIAQKFVRSNYFDQICHDKQIINTRPPAKAEESLVFSDALLDSAAIDCQPENIEKLLVNHPKVEEKSDPIKIIGQLEQINSYLVNKNRLM